MGLVFSEVAEVQPAVNREICHVDFPGNAPELFVVVAFLWNNILL